MLLTAVLLMTLAGSALGQGEDPRERARLFKLDADKLLKEKKIDKAISAYRKAIELWPEFPAAHNSLGKALYKKKDLEGAAEEYGLAAKHAPDFAVAHYNLAYVSRKLKRFDVAEREYRAYIALSPNDPDGYYGLAASLAGLGKKAEAAASYRKYAEVEKRPSEKKWVDKALAKAAKLEQETAAAMGVASPPAAAPATPPPAATAPAATAGPEVDDASKEVARQSKRKGDRLRKAKKYKEAARAYRKAVEIWPGFAKAHNELGQVLYRLKDNAGAEAEYSEAVRADPGYALGHFNLGFIRRKQGRFKEAEAPYRKYIELKPDDTDGYFGLAMVLEGLARNAEAAQYYRKYAAMEKRPKEKKWVNKALAKAEALEKQAASASPPPPAAATVTPTPAPTPRPATTKPPKAAKPGQWRFDAVDRMFRVSTAMAVRIQVEGGPAKVSEGLEREADQAVAGDDLSQAVMSYRDAVSRDAGNIAARYKLGVIYARQGRMPMAVSQWSKVLEVDPHNEPARRNLKLALSRTGGESEALTRADKTLSMLEQARGMNDGGRFAEAIPLLSDALRLSRSCAVCNAELARSYAGQGKAAMAAVMYKKALSYLPGLKAAILGSAELEAKAGNKAEAIRLYSLYISVEKDPARAAQVKAANRALVDLQR